MAIDILTETTISLKEACRLLPNGRGGRPTNFATIWRWV
jgi:hypothetical protein